MQNLRLTDKEGTSIMFNVANITYIKTSNAGVKIGMVDGKEIAVKEDIGTINTQLDELKK
jgi:hypothetical protein